MMQRKPAVVVPQDITEKRCPWCAGDTDYIHYHDTEWGVPQTDDKVLFEFLVLESFQAGLSWLTILKKRAAFGEAFADFIPAAVANFTPDDVAKLKQNKNIVRNEQKIRATINNAACFLQIQHGHGTFAHYLWGFVDYTQVKNTFYTMQDVPQTNAAARALSADMKKRGFTFVGPTIMYAYMQAVGLVNDHLMHCPRHHEIAQQTNGQTYGLKE